MEFIELTAWSMEIGEYRPIYVSADSIATVRAVFVDTDSPPEETEVMLRNGVILLAREDVTQVLERIRR